VFHPDLVGILLRVLQRLDAGHAIVVHGRDGMDEVSLGAATMVGELKDGTLSEYEIHPEDFGLTMASNRSLKVGSADESRRMLLEAIDGTDAAGGTAREIVILNSGVALYAANVADSIDDGIGRARAAIASGAARRKLDQFVAATRRLAQ
jgi:anthranilate phosphoribosyltransferase